MSKRIGDMAWTVELKLVKLLDKSAWSGDYGDLSRRALRKVKPEVLSVAVRTNGRCFAGKRRGGSVRKRHKHYRAC